MQEDPTIPAGAPGASSSEPSHLLPPDPVGALGGCRPLRVLGEGGMGVVYLARQEKFDRLVALKVMKPLDASARARFRREAKLAGALAHPNAVQVYDVGEEGGRLYLILEYVEGESLFERIRREGPLPERQAVSLVLQIAHVLQLAHEKGIIHRDVKPANILLHRHGIPKLCDLGLARPVDACDADSLTQSGVVLGSVAYMSPEQMADPRRADARADIYSLGATLYHLLTGRAPFAADSIVAMACRHAQDPRPDPRAVVPGVSERTVAAYRRMMAIDAHTRYATMAEVVAALEPIATGGADAVPRSDLREPTGVSNAKPSADPIAAGAPAGSPAPGAQRGKRIAIAAAILVLTVALAWGLLRNTGRIGTPESGGPANREGATSGTGPAEGPTRPTPVRDWAGETETSPDGRVTIRYEFADAREGTDWEAMPVEGGASARVEVRDGALFVSGGTPAVARFRPPLRAERVRVVATCLPGDWTNHINVYLNTQWQGNWEGNGGAACIHRSDGLLFCLDGRVEAEGLPPPCVAGRSYDHTIDLDEEGNLVWTIDGEVVHRAHAAGIAGRSGWILLGAYEAEVRIDRVEITGIRMSTTDSGR